MEMLPTDLVNLVSLYLPPLTVSSVAYDGNWYKTHLSTKYPSLSFEDVTGDWTELYQLSLSSGLPYHLSNPQQPIVNMDCIGASFTYSINLLLAANGHLYVYDPVHFPTGYLVDTGVLLISNETYVKRTSSYSWYSITAPLPGVKKKLLLTTNEPIIKLEFSYGTIPIFYALTSTTLHRYFDGFSPTVESVALDRLGISSALSITCSYQDLFYDSTGRVLKCNWKAFTTEVIAEKVARLDTGIIVYESGQWDIVVGNPEEAIHSSNLIGGSDMPAPGMVLWVDGEYLFASGGSLWTVSGGNYPTVARRCEWKRPVVKLCGSARPKLVLCSR